MVKLFKGQCKECLKEINEKKVASDISKVEFC